GKLTDSQEDYIRHVWDDVNRKLITAKALERVNLVAEALSSNYH
uniref:Antimicrobial protein PcfHb (Fragments) n=1 Tax=Potamotrygon cf. henlei TaxID=2805830 RepID=HBB_POTCF|nr:RecName: Full=Antimicrobial protein PcfHb [Potamotrygon cf. henlei KC-2012]